MSKKANFVPFATATSEEWEFFGGMNGGTVTNKDQVYNC